MRQATPDLLVNVILDRSGSMADQTSAVIDNYNNYIDELRTLGKDVRVSLIQFDTEYEEVYLNRSVGAVRKLTRNVYYARGATALLDAIGRTIKAVDSLDNKPEPSKIIVVVNTDGYENSSYEFSGSDIKELVADRERLGWKFIFMGAGIDAFTVGSQLNFLPNFTLSNSNSMRGYEYNYSVLGNYSGTMAAASPVEAYNITLDQSVSEVGTEDTFEVKKPKRKVTSKA